jgi:hypothetical protein
MLIAKQKKQNEDGTLQEDARSPLLKYALGLGEAKEKSEEEKGKGLISAKRHREERKKRQLEIAKINEKEMQIDYTAMRRPNMKQAWKSSDEDTKEETKIQEPETGNILAGTRANNQVQYEMMLSPSSFLSGK